VIVINKGKLVADDSLSDLLAAAGGRQVIIVEFESQVEADDLQKITGVSTVEPLEGNRFRLIPEAGADPRQEIFRFAADRNLSLLGLRQEESSLESVFRDLTVQSHDV
ncbi:MAG TPA: hypothetical protein VKZ75_02735, partial [Cyclobacteriaceae bacterium]|nr:hypothetical protein [Cyclobacteriaceae bacterium]